MKDRGSADHDTVDLLSSSSIFGSRFGAVRVGGTVMTTLGVRAGAARRFKWRAVPVAVVVLLVALLLPEKSIFAKGTQKYINGLWFNGQTFEQRTVFVSDGILKMQHDGDVTATIDLHGRHVIPPFADAHNHHFGEEPNYQQQLKLYLQQGCDLAIKNYKMSIELNPHNKNANEALKKLE
jgi:hypothetical protein